MKFWFDTEFIEAPNHLDLISIGIVCESGETLYVENSEVDWSRASQWVLDNVRPHLIGGGATKSEIAKAVLEFVNDNGGEPEFWADYASYDWVALCWLFGTMMDLPKGWPMFCRDIQQWRHSLGGVVLPVQNEGEHNALADARHCKKRWEFLNELAAAAKAVREAMEGESDADPRK